MKKQTMRTLLQWTKLHKIQFSTVHSESDEWGYAFAVWLPDKPVIIGKTLFQALCTARREFEK